jgi:hypothetical protein
MTPLPMSKHADPSQVERVRELIEGRACVIVGSAPLKTKAAEIAETELVIAVNGGISSVARAVDLWVVPSRLQDRPGNMIKPLHKVMLQQAKGRTVGHVLMLRGPKIPSEGDTIAALKHVGCRYHSWSVLDKPTKRWLEGEICGRESDKKWCSSGILATAIALWCGAASVRLVGFSFKPGYHYLPRQPGESWWRDHVKEDRIALRALQARYGARLSGAILQDVAA